MPRDLKPANILVDGRGWPYVADFGLAKRTGVDGLTVRGTIIGTPSYMAPEQAAGETGAMTTATDVYGLGAVLYGLLTGRAPFRGRTLEETLRQVRERPPVPVRELNSRVDPALEAVCLRCLEKDPGHRYASAEELAEGLEHWLAGGSVPSPRAVVPGHPHDRLRRPSIRPYWVGAAALAAVLAAGGVGIALLPRAGADRPAGTRVGVDDRQGPGPKPGTLSLGDHILLGKAHIAKRQFDAAIADFNAALAIDPESVSALVERGTAYYNKGQPRRALEDFEVATRLDREHAYPYIYRGRIARDRGELEVALAAFDEGIARNPEIHDAYCERGRILVKKKEFGRAVADLTEAIRSDPRCAIAYRSRAGARDGLGERDKAEADRRRAGELESESSRSE